MSKTITRTLATALLFLALGGGALAAEPSAGPTEPPVLQFYPQAGIPWQDLYFVNFVDLDPGPGTRDWSCGTQTYDGHTGEDSMIRSFQEKRIGVPVFAAIDGVVIEVSDLLPDEHVYRTMTPVDNHVIVSSLGRHLRTVYGHLRKGVLVRPGQRVVAGQQLGWTASSGHSTGPHLHFTMKLDLQVYEPFAGPCRAGKSYWRSQPELPSAAYVRDFTFSRRPFGGRRDPPWDEAVRTGTFPSGVRDVYFRTELAFFDGRPIDVTFVRPDDTVALSVQRQTLLQGARTTFATWHERLDLDRPGTWRLVLASEGSTLVDAPFTVGTARNRPPNAITLSLEPASPTTDDVIRCLVRTSLVTEDPDYAIVRYRYRWRVNGKLVRSLTSAGLSDVLRHRLAESGQRVSCTVTPSDGELLGPVASARVTVR